MNSLNTTSVSLAVTPTVVSTLFSHVRAVLSMDGPIPCPTVMQPDAFQLLFQLTRQTSAVL